MSNPNGLAPHWLLFWSNRFNVLGEQVLYRPETLHEQRDFPILNPYKPVLIEQVLARMGLPTVAAKRALLMP